MNTCESRFSVNREPLKGHRETSSHYETGETKWET